jgi:ketosteroid isomerase-like protein
MGKTRIYVHAGALLTLAMLLISPAFSQQTAPPVGAPPAGADPEAASRSAAISAGDTSPAAMKVKEFEKKLEAAVVAGDVAYVSSVLADDFVMVHSDEWTSGGNPRVSDNKQSFLANVARKNYLVRDLDSVKVEMHGDIAITHGRVVGQEGKQEKWFSLWYERVYAKRNGKWMYVSGRTVRGPVNGTDRASVQDK